MTDEEFFTTFPDRQARIRKPERILEKNKQRTVRYLDENDLQFLSLGPHDKDRRQVIVWRVPEGSPYYEPEGRKLLKVPFLLLDDETVEDRDDKILPILEDIMKEALTSYG